MNRPKDSLDYRIAAAYTERQWRSRRWWRACKLLAGLFLISAPIVPFVYAIAAPILSDGLTASWFKEWAVATTPLSHAWSYASPGISRAAEKLYTQDPTALLVFSHFAILDLGLIILTVAIAITASARLSLFPGSATLEMVRRTARGFPITTGLNPETIGGKVGGLVFAMLIVLFVPLVIYLIYAEPLLQSGQFSVDAHSHCVAYDAPWWSKRRDCVQWVDNDLVQTVWKLGWMSSLATVLIPFGIWLTTIMALYPFWLLRQELDRS